MSTFGKYFILKQAYPLVKRVDDDLKSIEENLVYKSSHHREKNEIDAKDQHNTSKNSFFTQTEITEDLTND